MSLLIMISVLNQLVPNQMYPYPELMKVAEEEVLLARSMFSDYPEIYRYTWSFGLEGSCISFDEPCNFDPFTPSEYSMPISLWTQYQQLVYTPPQPGKTKASLALSTTISLYSAGIIWHLTVNAEGIKHDIWFCEYRTITRRIEITPLVYIRVKFLEPVAYHHVSAAASGTYNLQTHKIKQWDLSWGIKRLMYDAQDLSLACGTSAFIYTTKPGEVLMDIFNMPDAASLGGADKQVILTPKLGTRKCGEFAYEEFISFMTHRGVETPSFYSEGPPLEVWSFQEGRDASAPTAEVLDPESSVTHQHMKLVKEDLTELGIQGPLVTDSDMNNALDLQADHENQRYKQGTDLGVAALGLLEFLRNNPQNGQLWNLYQKFVSPHIEHIEWMNDTEIEFDISGPHCVDDQGKPIKGYAGHIPILGQHFFPELECRFCDIHDLILRNPYNGFSFKRLVDMGWHWGSIHSQRGDLRETAHKFIQRLISVEGLPPRATLHDEQEERALWQRTETHQGQVDEVGLNELESIPSGTTINSTQSKSKNSIPPIFLEPFEPCTDPSWTAEFLLMYGEITNVFDGPCDLLWGVKR